MGQFQGDAAEEYHMRSRLNPIKTIRIITEIELDFCGAQKNKRLAN